MVQRIIRNIDKLENSLVNHSRNFLLLSLFLIIALVHTNDSWMTRIPIRCLAILMIIGGKDLLSSKLLWSILTLSLGISNFRDWYIIDNHQYLLTYTALAITLSLFSYDFESTIKKSSRLLIGLTFLFAFSWKLIGGQYLNGDFFLYTFLTDSRLELLSQFLGFEDNQRYYNYMTYHDLINFGKLNQYVLFDIKEYQIFLCKILSWITLVIEGLIAICFLFNSKRIVKIRDYVLLIFILSTYLFIPVLGFAMLLLFLGIAQLDQVAHTKFKQYLFVLVFIQFTLLPLADIFH